MDLQEERKNYANKYHAVLEILVCLVFLLLFIFNFHDIVWLYFAKSHLLSQYHEDFFQFKHLFAVQTALIQRLINFVLMCLL